MQNNKQRNCLTHVRVNFSQRRLRFRVGVKIMVSLLLLGGCVIRKDIHIIHIKMFELRTFSGRICTKEPLHLIFNKLLQTFQKVWDIFQKKNVIITFVVRFFKNKGRCGYFGLYRRDWLGPFAACCSCQRFFLYCRKWRGRSGQMLKQAEIKSLLFKSVL